MRRAIEIAERAGLENAQGRNKISNLRILFEPMSPLMPAIPDLALDLAPEFVRFGVDGCWAASARVFSSAHIDGSGAICPRVSGL